SSWSTCHKILHILMFITSFEDQAISFTVQKRSTSPNPIILSYFIQLIKTLLTYLEASQLSRLFNQLGRIINCLNLIAFFLKCQSVPPRATAQIQDQCLFGQIS